MICPNMATMLSFLFTDACVEQGFLSAALRKAVAVSFNSITVEGDTSTNDTVLLLANGLAGNAQSDKKFQRAFAQALKYVCVRLAKMIAADGEGATKLVEVMVRGATTAAGAKQAARTVANSVLVKTALFGQQANWGRVAAALGRSGVEGYDPASVSIGLNGHVVMAGGAPCEVNKAALEESMKNRDITIEIDLGAGSRTWKVWTSDLSYEYIRCNIEIS
jgi:glutamate N-acetyltransferase/amino-acid N-acetyltransferase